MIHEIIYSTSRPTHICISMSLGDNVLLLLYINLLFYSRLLNKFLQLRLTSTVPVVGIELRTFRSNGGHATYALWRFLLLYSCLNYCPCDIDVWPSNLEIDSGQLHMRNNIYVNHLSSGCRITVRNNCRCQGPRDFDL